jgi:hypothetical protein
MLLKQDAHTWIYMDCHLRGHDRRFNTIMPDILKIRFMYIVEA